MKKIFVYFIMMLLTVPLSAQKKSKNNNTLKSSFAVQTVTDFSCDVFEIHPVENDNDIEDVELGASEVLVHELAHHFNLNLGDYDIVDLEVLTPLNHEGSDVGVMSYSRDPDNGVVEFSLECIFHIRNLLDGI